MTGRLDLIILYSMARGHHASLDVRAAADVLSNFCIDFNFTQKILIKTSIVTY